MHEAWIPPEAPTTVAATARRSDLVAMVAALAALVLFVGAFAYIAQRNDGDDAVTATAPDGTDDERGSDGASTAAAGIVADEHAHAGDDHAHDGTAEHGHDDGHAHDDATSHEHSTPHAHDQSPATAQPAAAAPPDPVAACDGSPATTTTTTTTTTVPHHDDNHHHLTAAPVSLTRPAAACDPTTTTTLPPATQSQPTTTTTATTAPTTTTTVHDHHSDWPGAGKQFDDVLATNRAVAYQIGLVTQWAMQFPTTADARREGYIARTEFFPGIAQHYVNLSLLDGRFDPLRPEVLLYGEQGELVGINYIVSSGSEPPDGFEGDWDLWHEHEWLCFGPPNGLIISEQPPGECPGNASPFTGNWLLHVWSIEGWDAPEGIFAHENSRVATLIG